MTLFAEQGYEQTTLEQVAERAEVSPATFFRYFRGKSDLMLSEVRSRLPVLIDAFTARPHCESDFEAARHIFTARDDIIDLKGIQQMTRTFAASSPVLDEARFKIMREWQGALSEALAARRKASAATADDRLAARIILSLVSSGLEEWMKAGCSKHVTACIEQSFLSMDQYCRTWKTPDPAVAPFPVTPAKRVKKSNKTG